jgi:hypothetical protein
MALRKVHLTNAAGRDATVELAGAKKPVPPRLGLPGHQIRFKRYLGAPEQGLGGALAERFGQDYGQALIDGDPETDLETVGREIGETSQVFLSAEGEVLHAPPEIVEVIVDAFGKERERRSPEDQPANVNEDLPVRWTRTKITRLELVRRFVVNRTVQVRHVDGLTYDYLYAMAQELAEEGKVVLLGAGQKGRDPLVFYTNGSPYRAFLEGRIDGERYQLLLHLSNMELKKPAPPAPGEAAAETDGEKKPEEGGG